MLERFTDGARKVVVLAQEEAGHFGHHHVGTEHLLLGLLREDERGAARALSARGITAEAVRGGVKNVVGYGTKGSGDGAPFSKRARSALETARREAERSGPGYVDTGHLLLALVREPGAVAVRVLSDLGVDPEQARREVAMPDRTYEQSPPDAKADGEPGGTAFRARVGGLEVHAHCGVSEVERALPQLLLVDLEYSYEAFGEDDLSGVVDYGALLEGAARVLESEEFKLLETGARKVGEHVLGAFPAVREVTVSVTKVRVPVARSLSGASVSATFRR